MTDLSFGQFCGMAKAFEIIGPRWSALIIRDLLLGPKPFAELHAGLPRVSVALLRRRIDDLEAAGVLHAADGVTYELTDYGKSLERILLELGLWGARSLGDPHAGDMFSLDMAILALRATFRPDRARDVRATFEIHLGEMVVNARVDHGVLTVEEGELHDADLIIETPLLKNLMAAELSPTDALWLGLVDAKGDPGMLNTFVQLFHIPAPPPVPAKATSL